MANESDVTVKVKADTSSASKEINKFSKEAEASLSNAASEAQDGFKSLFNTSSAGVLNLAKGFGVASLAIGAAGFAISEAFSTAQLIAETADEVTRVNTQFDFLASKAGDVGGVLKKTLSETNQGINDFEDVLGAANSALVNTQLNTDQIGKNFEAARRLSVALGVDSLQAFEAINTAIASGNTKALKQVGLFIDAQSAIDGYARSVGVAAKFLTDAQKEAALFEAVQSKVSANFGNVDTQTIRTSESFKQFGEAVKDVGEAASIGLNKIFGPAIQAILARFTEELAGLSTGILKRFGNETQQAAAKQEELEQAIKIQQARLAEFRKELEVSTGARKAYFETKISRGEAALAPLQKEADLIRRISFAEQEEQQIRQAQSNTKKALSADEIKAQEDLTNARLALLTKVNQQEIANLDSKIALAQTNEEFTQAFAERELLVQQELQQQKADIEKQFASVGLQNSQAKADAIQAVEDAAAVKRFNTQKAFGDKMLALQKQQEAKEIADRDTFLSTAATLQNAKNKELATIGKAAAITQIAIKTPPAVASSFEFGTKLGGPPLGFIFASIAATAMAAQAAAIAGVPLATGITSVPSGFPNDTFAANLTSGERVVNVKQNEDLTTFLEKQSKSDSNADTTNGWLEAIANRLSQLENTIVVNIGNKEIVREVRDGLRAGRTLAV